MRTENTIRAALVALLSTSIFIACDQDVDKGDDKMTEGNQSVEVVYNNGDPQIVEFDNLTTQTILNDVPGVSVEEIVLGSGLVLDAEDLWLNFIGSDGYSPLGNDNCTDPLTPTPGDVIGQVFVERGTRNLYWLLDSEVEGCMIVKDVEAIHVADDPEDLYVGGDTDTDSDSDSDTDPAEGTLDVDYEGLVEEVDYTQLGTTTVDGHEVVLLSELIDAAGFTPNLDLVELSFEGSDGYNPTEQGTCTEALPAPGANASLGGVSVTTGDLEWDPSLEYPGCAHVKDLAIVYVTDL